MRGKLTSAANIRAWLDGRVAARNDKPLSACPHSLDEGAESRILGTMWVRGWRSVAGNNQGKAAT